MVRMMAMMTVMMAAMMMTMARVALALREAARARHLDPIHMRTSITYACAYRGLWGGAPGHISMMYWWVERPRRGLEHRPGLRPASQERQQAMGDFASREALRHVEAPGTS